MFFYDTLKSLVDKVFGPAGLEPPAGARKMFGWKIIMSFYDTLISLVDNVYLPRRVGDPCRMPCRVRKEVWLEPPAGARIRKKTKTTRPYLKKNKNKRGGYLCSKC